MKSYIVEYQTEQEAVKEFHRTSIKFLSELIALGFILYLFHQNPGVPNRHLQGVILNFTRKFRGAYDHSLTVLHVGVLEKSQGNSDIAKINQTDRDIVNSSRGFGDKLAYTILKYIQRRCASRVVYIALPLIRIMLADQIPAEFISIWYLIEKCVWTTGNSGLILHEIRLHIEVHFSLDAWHCCRMRREFKCISIW